MTTPTTARVHTVTGLALLAGGIVLATPSDAMAYVDPGAGSFLFQIAAGGLLAALYTMRSYWQTLTSSIRGRRTDAASPESSSRRAHDMD